MKIMSRGSSLFFKNNVEEAIRLGGLECLTPHLSQKIYAVFESLDELTKAKKADLIAMGLTENEAQKITDRPKDVSAQLSALKKHNMKIVFLDDDSYPELLREINDPPLWLFVKGDLATLKRPTLTVVGTRKPSTYALSVMEKVLGSTLLEKVTTVSGLAYGVDKKAHELSLSCGGQTVAVLAGGLDAIYPAAHTNLAEKIIEQGGALISEYPPLSRPAPYRFPIRNRIIAGLSPLTVIIEAAIKSGTLTTAKSAIDYNRDLMAIPGDITRTQSEGTNFLLKKGAYLLDSANDLLEYYNIKPPKKALSVDSQYASLLHLLSDGPKTVDELMAETGQGVEIILAGLTELELSGLVRQDQIGVYVATK